MAWSLASLLFVLGVMGFAAVEDWNTPRKTRAVLGILAWPLMVIWAYAHGFWRSLRDGYE